MASESKYHGCVVMPPALFPSLLNLVFHLCSVADGADVLKEEEMIQSSTPR